MEGAFLRKQLATTAGCGAQSNSNASAPMDTGKGASSAWPSRSVERGRKGTLSMANASLSAERDCCGCGGERSAWMSPAPMAKGGMGSIVWTSPVLPTPTTMAPSACRRWMAAGPGKHGMGSPAPSTRPTARQEPSGMGPTAWQRIAVPLAIMARGVSVWSCLNAALLPLGGWATDATATALTPPTRGMGDATPTSLASMGSNGIRPCQGAGAQRARAGMARDALPVEAGKFGLPSLGASVRKAHSRWASTAKRLVRRGAH